METLSGCLNVTSIRATGNKKVNLALHTGDLVYSLTHWGFITIIESDATAMFSDIGISYASGWEPSIQKE